jgi:hypothetical protein
MNEIILILERLGSSPYFAGCAVVGLLGFSLILIAGAIETLFAGRSKKGGRHER